MGTTSPRVLRILVTAPDLAYSLEDSSAVHRWLQPMGPGPLLGYLGNIHPGCLNLALAALEPKASRGSSHPQGLLNLRKRFLEDRLPGVVELFYHLLAKGTSPLRCRQSLNRAWGPPMEYPVPRSSRYR